MLRCLCNNQQYAEISQNTSYLRGNIDTGIGEIMGTGYCVNDVQMMQADESPQNDHTN